MELVVARHYGESQTTRAFNLVNLMISSSLLDTLLNIFPSVWAVRLGDFDLA